MANFLRLRNRHYYLRIRVPADLRNVLPEAEILKSLRTKDRKTAAVTALRLHNRILEVFTLTRAEFILPSQAKERLDDLLGRQQDNYRPKADLNSQSILPPSPSLTAVIAEYIRDHKSAWTAKTLLEYRGYFKLLQDVLNVPTVADITRDAVRNMRETLCLLPSNLYKRYPSKSINQIVCLKDITPMSVTTVNKLLGLFSSLMRHCVKEGYIKQNPAEGLKVQHKKSPDEERKAYSSDDLKRMISALPSPDEKPEKHWVPLIGMYSGMRLGEICGLHLEDVKQIDGIWCFDVNAEQDKTLKTKNSKRIVPIHPQLIRAGFLDLIQRTSQKGENRLWPNLKRREIDGYCHAFGNWFGRFNRKHITSDPLKSFHSLRHTFADTLKQAGEQEALIAELMGHANGNITTGRYGKRYRPKVLLEAISKLSFDGQKQSLNDQELRCNRLQR